MRNAGIPADRANDYAQTPSGGYNERGYDAPRARAADYDRGRSPNGERRDDYGAGGYGSDRRAGDYGNTRSSYGGGAQPSYDSAPTRTYAGEAARPNQQVASLPPQQREADTRISDGPQQIDRASPRATSGGPSPLSRSTTPGLRTTQPPTSAKDNSIEVQPGDTLSSISRQYRVSVAELMKLNGLDNPNLRPGQRVVLPAGRRPLMQHAAIASAQPQTSDAHAGGHIAGGGQPAATPMQSTAASSAAAGTYTVQAGESLYGIARKHSVKVAELQQANGISDVTKIKPGTVLKIPGAGGQTQAVAPTRLVRTTTVMSDAGQPEMKAQPETSTLSVRPKIINGDTTTPTEPKRVASLGVDEQTASDAEGKGGNAGELSDPPKLAGTGKFRWPVKGKIIAGFGARPGKPHNDGINISVPQGTEVLASESGVVAYAGNEIKGYGNLVLIRHDGGWVSAYAHGDELLVKRGDKVRRGQPIAKAGNTGAVDQPQVHFELRQDSKPVDPMPHMEK